MKHRILSLTLAICMLFTLLSGLQLGAAASSDDEVAYYVEGGKIYFDKSTGTVTGSEKYVTGADIPAEIEGVTVTAIGNYAFHYGSLERLTLPDTVTTIGTEAFLGCSSLSDITLGNGMTTIGKSAFEGCGMTEIIIPESVTSIGASAFRNCDNLSIITIPNYVTYIGSSAFYDCDNLEVVWLPSGITTIEDYTFQGCEKLLVVPIPDGVTTIGANAFKDCIALTGIDLPSSVTTINHHAYSGCEGLEELTLLSFGYGLTTMGNNVFSGCSGLKSVDLPLNLEAIPSNAFYDCDNLSSVTVSASVTEVGDWAFAECGNLESVVFLGDLPSFGNYVFNHVSDNLTLYYLEGRAGWTSPTWNGYQTAIAEHTHCYYIHGTEPTCTEKGYVWYTCACGESYVSEELDELGHNYVDGKCSRCGEADPNATHTHSYTAKVTEPTCTAKGFTTYTCSCGDFYWDNYTDALGHSYTVKVTPPTCTKMGYTTYTCKCGFSYKDDYVDEIEHDYTAEVRKPSCTIQGYTTYTCKCGVNYVVNFVDELGHNYKNGKCTRCGKADPNASSNNYTSVSFKDVAKTAWYKEAVDYVVSNGLMNGMGNNKFEPDTTMTRAMLVTVLWRYAGSPKEGTNTFKDVKSGQWFTEAVTWAAKNGIVTGVGNNKFDPEGKLTREQLVTILFRYSKQLGLDTSASGDYASFFKDGKKVQSWADEAVQWGVSAGIISGYSEGGWYYLDPQGNATRAQVATILMRYITKQVNGHSYGLVVDNCSWWDAQKEAKARGGYLVNINSMEEFNYIISQIKTEGLQDVYFRIGGRRAEDSKKYYMTDVDGKLFGDCLNADGAWCESLWLDGEPNYEWKGADEAYMEMYYSEEAGTWVWCDVANRPAYPTDESKIGYIIEFERKN